MAVVAIIIYQGTILEPERFRDHYEQVHVPLLWHLPGIRSIELDWDRAGEIRLVSHLIFDTTDELVAALNGPARDPLRVDMEENLIPLFDGHVLRAESQRIVFDAPTRP